MLRYANFQDRHAAAEFKRIVEKYDLRWEPQPHRLYPVGQMSWPPVGWLPMIERLVVRLIRLGWDRHLAQAKVKFGGLRFYVGKVNPDARAAIDRAQARSFRICDDCGRPGRQREENGTAIRCAKHRPRDGSPSLIQLLEHYRVAKPSRK